MAKQGETLAVGPWLVQFIDVIPTAGKNFSAIEAELIAIDGLYRTADEMDPQYRSRPVQAWLDGETMTMAALS